MNKRGIRNSKGQLQISFGMIFTILLIIVFIAFAFFGIKKFMEVQNEILSKKLVSDLNADIEKMWKSSRGSEEVTYNVPNKADSVCFGEKESEYEDDSYNVYFLPEGEFDTGKLKYVDFEKTLGDKDEICFDTENNRVSFVISKNYGENLVTISGEVNLTRTISPTTGGGTSGGNNNEGGTSNENPISQPQATGNGNSRLIKGVPLIHAQTFVIPENAVLGDTVGDLNLMWINSNQQVSFSLTNDDSGRFSINSNARISVASANFNYDSKQEHQITVRATETSTGKYNDAIITIKLTKTEDTVFIDPSWSGCHDGTRACPYNSWGSVSFQSGKDYLQKRGTTVTQSSGGYGLISISADGTSSNHLIVGAYGSGNRPDVDCSSNSEGRSIFLGSGYNHDGSDAANYVDLYSFSVHGCNGIRDSYNSKNLIFRDIIVHHSFDNGGIYIWQDVRDETPDNMNILMEDIVAHDMGAPDRRTHGIKCQGGGVTVRNLLTYNNAAHGISFPIESAYNTVEYVLAYGNGGGGVEMGGFESTLNYALVYKNYYGVEIDEDTNYDTTISNIVAYDNYANGMLVWGSLKDITIEDSEIYNNEGPGIKMRSASSSITIKNNDIYGNTNGISFGTYEGGSPFNVQISTNNIHDNTINGVNVDVGKDITISNNRIYGNPQSVYVSPSAVNVQQSNNQAS